MKFLTIFDNDLSPFDALSGLIIEFNNAYATINKAITPIIMYVLLIKSSKTLSSKS